MNGTSLGESAGPSAGLEALEAALTVHYGNSVAHEYELATDRIRCFAACRLVVRSNRTRPPASRSIAPES